MTDQRRIVIQCPRAATIKARAHEIRQALALREMCERAGVKPVYRVPAKTRPSSS